MLNKRALQLTKSGPMRLPVLGSVIQLQRANPHYAHVALAKLATKYGDVMSFGFGMQFAGKNLMENLFKFSYSFIYTLFLVVFSSFEAMKSIFQRVDTNSNRFEFPYVYDRNYGKNLGENSLTFDNSDTVCNV